MILPDIHIDDYTYDLPPERIAQYPLPERDASKLLVWMNGSILEDHFRNLPAYLSGRSLLVFNNTRVIRARLIFRKSTGSLVEIFCLEPLEPTREVSEAFGQMGPVTWKCLIGGSKRWKSGILELEVSLGAHLIKLKATRREDLGDGTFAVRFTWEHAFRFGDVLEGAGRIPLPPYITRTDEPDDLVRYQTVYAREQGSVAAPTAGLHFTSSVLSDLEKKQIRLAQVTLHVGLGTFRPVSSPDISLHRMHREQFLVGKGTIMRLLDGIDQPVIAVGTTSVRTLESLYWLGIRQLISPGKPETEVGQWDSFNLPAVKQVPPGEALNSLLREMERAGTTWISAGTSLMIVPGYRFQVVDGMITNFHQPRSTLLLLIAAYLGDNWKDLYRYALDHDFRFLSYGDSCLFLHGQERKK